ncbi:beta-phosphoglucomutase family hydrolase [Noviherbaspirillum sp. UKPF54]|uniref:beta-phosphoglucomutase family hydrolase n=1 Tax=Noviherbaspirillum sp. UKPF54 TaxID=2601898 RepID=UPI001FEE810D|nr:beta-phosphoglucomutase family hydrolase [Noviherbaspirillum sp. UKPF54]
MSGGLRAAIFDMDGVITRTADLHAAAWKTAFDDMLRRHAQDGVPYRPFDESREYRAYVDGKPRSEGVRSFLRARELVLSTQEEEDVAARKDALFEQLVRERGVQTFASTLALIAALRRCDVKIAVVTSSRHGRGILCSAGIMALFDTCLDGVDLARLGLKGKPDPDMFLHAAQALGVTPGHAMVVEDAAAGVEAGRRGEFGLVVGIDRGDNATALRRAGAHVVVQDLAELGVEELDAAFLARREQISWRIEQEGFDRARERQMESIFAVGNGYLGVRGALDCPLHDSQGDMFIAGVYDSKRADLPYSEIEFLAPERGTDPHAELVPLPFPFRLTVSVAGTSLDFAGPYGRQLRRVLDLRRAELHSEALYETPGGRRTMVRTRRCASLADPHLLLQEAAITPENHWGEIELGASLHEPQSAERHPHLELVELAEMDGLEVACYTTRASGIRIVMASRIMHEQNILRRLISVFTSRDVPDPRAAALAHVQAQEGIGFEQLLAAHAERWASFWSGADIRVPGHPAVEQALRFGGYHLKLPAGDDARVSIGARTLTGRAYEGHVFWDTEIFMLPFFLHVEPVRARNLLLYRHHTLDGARRRARQLGYRGACFAWESTVTGDDVTPTKIVLKSTGKEIPVFTGSQQVHVTADIAYAVWRYWEATRDQDFLFGPGADILFETARFWASRVTRGDKHVHIRAVVGPDEYHHDVNDNAYTNWMARFNLERAVWLAQQCASHADEAQEWAALAQSLYIPAPDEHGVIEQFEGFFALDDYPLSREERFKAPVSRLFDWQQVNRLKLLKQADVLMLPLLFPDAFSDDVVAANYRYYEPLTDHGSSLSPSVHAAIAARIGLREDAERYWRQSLWLDLSDAMNNSMLGVHPAAMGGAWQALVFGFLGIGFDETQPRADARAAQRLPAGWNSVALTLAYRGRTHTVRVAREPEMEPEMELEMELEREVRQ